jgi:hypothetical protein
MRAFKVSDFYRNGVGNKSDLHNDINEENNSEI